MERLAILPTAICLLVACGDSTDSADQETPQISGDWALTYSTARNTCEVEGNIFPMAPGTTHVDQLDERLTLTSVGGEQSFTFARTGRTWTRERRGELDGCVVALVEQWLFHDASRSRLSAQYSATFEAFGAADSGCQSACEVEYAVWGVKR